MLGECMYVCVWGGGGRGGEGGGEVRLRNGNYIII